MSLYKALLIDIIYSLRKDHLDNEQAESKQLDMDRYNLATNYQIVQSLIDIIFEILKDQPIKFNPNLRSRQDFLYAKQQISSLDTTIELDGFNPAITKEERLEIENPNIRRIILEQELVPQNADPEQSILFIHLMFLTFREIRQINSMIVKRKYVLLKIFEQSTYSYKCQAQDHRFCLKANIQNHIHGPKDQIVISQCIGQQSIQDLSIRSDQSMNQQCQQFHRLNQIDTNQQNQSGESRQMSQMPQDRFYFGSIYPTQIEELSSGKIKMTFTKGTLVYQWSQLDLSSYFKLMTTHPEAFDSWESMLKLLNGKQFQGFINNQLGDSESDDEKVDNHNVLDQQLMDKEMQFHNLRSIDSVQSIGYITNQGINRQQSISQEIIQSIKSQISIVDNLIIRKNQIKEQTQQVKKQFHLNCTLQEWYARQKRLENRTIWNYACLGDQVSETTTPQEWQIKVVNQFECNDDRVMKIDEGVQTLQFYESLDGQELQKRNKVVEIRIDQFTSDGKKQDVQESISVDYSFNYVEGQHKGEWIFKKYYPLKIVKLSQQRLLFTMKKKKIDIVEWWQLNYDSLKTLLLEKGTKLSAYIWSVMLILIDEEQFFQLWKGEVSQQRQIINHQIQHSLEKDGFQELQNTEQTLNISGKDLPVTIVQYAYNFIIKFKNYVEIFTQTEFEQFQVKMLSQDIQPNSWQVQKRRLFYSRKMNLFKERLLTEQKSRSQQAPLYFDKQVGDTKLSQNKEIGSQSNSRKGLWLFYEDYPIRIDLIGKDSLRFQFKNKMNNALVKWQQLEYKSLIQLIDEKINITAAQTWSNMLMLLDHNQFYRLWKGYYYWQETNEAENKQAEKQTDQLNQAQITTSQCKNLQTDKRDPPDQIPQMIVKLDSLKSIVKFQNYVEILTNDQVATHEEVLEFTESQFSKLKIKQARGFYNQSIRALKQRLKLEISQDEELKRER